jgi:hypothetical protein
MMAILVLVYTGLIMHMESGPFWDIFLQDEARRCKKNWWTAILHLQNYIDPFEMVCNGLVGRKMMQKNNIFFTNIMSNSLSIHLKIPQSSYETFQYR